MFVEQSWILKRTSLTPKLIALVNLETQEQWTYQQLTEEITKWCHFFERQNLRAGSRVAVFAKNHIQLFAVLFACGLRGLIYVPLNWRLSAKELHDILTDATPSLLLYDEEMNCPVSLENMHSLRLASEAATLSIREVDLNDPWLMIYTGGTTGKAKGVVLSFNSVNWNAINTIISWGLNDRDCTLNYMPLFHTGGLNALCIPLLMAGGTVVIGDKFEAENALQAINQYKTTISLFVPTMYQAMIATDYFKENCFPSMNVFLSGGAPCPYPIYDAFIKKGLFFKEGYGLTEAGPNNFYISREAACLKKGAVGKSMQFNEAKIINSAGESCAPNEVGELFVRGKHMFLFYWNNQQETEKIMHEGWLKTGDLAMMDEDGDFYIVGRSKEMIISGGENVYPQEVEQCILRHQLVQEVAVIGIADEYWGEIVVAFIVCQNQDETILEEIKEICNKHLGRYKIPKKIIVIDELPKTSVGKIDKKALQMYAKAAK
ncbi:long-chain fatty acid--CoA ligase [Lysinibacillus sp. KCTC 33748]|uniref:class I adenylate-forming enzyme family protein n=1 Tax=unclassified Lysinibacillus TaxID=2636778 RepID=UPI0009A7E460|nr:MULTISPECIES: AMP-binding protein [unclassified Lysinibacillus]OXS73251.1 long-chain fatty acid--CoA ligase [Lysinibacillus sp. KCTC 33748]SKB83440.1 fatty-acyl-CoA synthase [Lysinibacillus sp. AC-3]